MKKTPIAVILAFGFAVGILTPQRAQGEREIFRADLKAYGFSNEKELTRSSLSFLSDSLLLVTINELWTIPMRISKHQRSE